MSLSAGEGEREPPPNALHFIEVRGKKSLCNLFGTYQFSFPADVSVNDSQSLMFVMHLLCWKVSGCMW